jgi:hypothetical protein
MASTCFQSVQDVSVRPQERERRRLVSMKTRPSKFQVITSDDLRIREEPFSSLRDAEKALLLFVKRFRIRGHYRDASGNSIPL